MVLSDKVEWFWAVAYYPKALFGWSAPIAKRIVLLPFHAKKEVFAQAAVVGE